MDRKLPLYFIIGGTPTLDKDSFEVIWNGLQLLKDTFLKDPYALENLHVSVIQVSSDAWSIDALTPIDRWRIPLLHPEGTGELALGAAFKILDYRISQEVIPKSLEFKGDFCPLVFIMVDSPPTDDWVNVTSSVLNRTHPHIGSCFMVLVGSDVKPSDFEQVPSLNPVTFDDDITVKSRQFFRWVDQ